MIFIIDMELRHKWKTIVETNGSKNSKIQVIV